MPRRPSSRRQPDTPGSSDPITDELAALVAMRRPPGDADDSVTEPEPPAPEKPEPDDTG